MAGWRQTRDYRVWRAQVIRRDKVCKVCGTLKARHAHHLNHATYFPEQRFDVSNGITLCGKCHSHFHNDFKKSTREKCTEHDMKEYQKLAEYFMERAIFLTFTALEDQGNLKL